MQRIRHFSLFIVSTIIAVITNLSFNYISYIKADTVFLDDQLISKTLVNDAVKELSDYEYEDYFKASDYYRHELFSLDNYYTALQVKEGNIDPFGNTKQYANPEYQNTVLSTYDYNLSQTAYRICLYSYCLERLQYALDYADYINQISTNSSELSVIDIFDEKTKKNIIKTGKDFSGMQNLVLSATPDTGFLLLLKDSFTDSVAILLSIILALIYCNGCITQTGNSLTKKNHLGMYSILVSSVITLLYVSNAIIINKSFVLGNLSRPIQSITCFASCQYCINTGTFIAIRILFKAVSCLIIYLFVVGIITSQNKKWYMLGTTLGILAIISLVFGRNWIVGLWTCLHPEALFASYKNIFVFGETVNSFIILILFTITLLLAASFLAGKMVSNISLLAKEKAEQIYFEEINKRYNEARLIRHDIKNHMAAIAMLLDNNDIDGAKRYLGEVFTSLDDIKPPAKTGSNVLDALLFRKVSTAKENEVTITADFSTDLSDISICDFDICSIFSNMLDNAIEAVQKLDVKDRVITLTVKKHMDMTCIICQNKYSEIEKIDDTFVTLKKDSYAHGLGLKRIQQLVSKYNGAVEITTDNNVFTISILI